MQKLALFLFLGAIIVIGAAIVVKNNSHKISSITTTTTTQTPTPMVTPTPDTSLPLSIAAIRVKKYPGSDLHVEQVLSSGQNYHRYVVSYLSDRLKIYGLLTVPFGEKPSGGWPVIVINHGYIPPAQYSTGESYAGVVEAFASAKFITFKPDYRGNGNSEGQPTQVYISPDYVTDSMNAIASIKKYPDANSQKVGIWAHSMGGNITLHEVVIPVDAQAINIWSGVVGNYTDILTWWDKRIATGVLTTQNDQLTASRVNQFRQQHATPQTNPDFWNSIDPTQFLSSVTVPVFIQVGTADAVVPANFSMSLYASLKNLGKDLQITTYPGADHNLIPDSVSALSSSIAFFNKYLR